MLIYDRDNLRLYAAELRLPDPAGRSRREAEAAAMAGLLREAFPNGGAEPRHHPTGAPYLEGAAGEKYEISISHCRRMAIVALAPRGSRIGVDCESADRAGQLRRVAGRFLSTGEYGRWSRSEALLSLAWTIKEAAFKAAGDPTLTMRAIPLPDTAPTENSDADCQMTIGGRRYRVFGVAAPIEGITITIVRGL